MFAKMRRTYMPLAFLLAIFQCLPVSYAADPPYYISKLFPFLTEDKGKKPETNQENCMEELAKNIDWLEHQIDLYGSVVPKTPDIWGEARLTAHRQEFERELAQELTQFNKNTINGAEYVNDQAFLSFALAMNARGSEANPDLIPEVSVSTTTTGDTAAAVTGNAATAKITGYGSSTTTFGFDATKLNFGPDGMITLEQTEVLDQFARYINHLHQLRRINEGDDTADTPGYSMNLVRVPVSVLPGCSTKRGYGAEITLTAEPYMGPELLPMAFRDLVINDLVDQLSLAFTRFVNSDPKAAKELLASFRDYEEQVAQIRKQYQQISQNGNFYSSDIYRYLAVRVHAADPQRTLMFFNSDGSSKFATVEGCNLDEFVEEYDYLVDIGDPKLHPEYVALAYEDLQKAFLNKGYQDPPPEFFRALGMASIPNGNFVPVRPSFNLVPAAAAPAAPVIQDGGEVQKAVKRLWPEGEQIDVPMPSINPTAFRVAEPAQAMSAEQAKSQIFKAVADNYTQQKLNPVLVASFQRPSLVHLQQSICLPSSATRRSTLPFPPSQLLDNYGTHGLAHVTDAMYHALRSDILNREVVHITDVRGYLQEELAAAYELLKSAPMQVWWDAAVQEPYHVAEAIRMRRLDELERMQCEFQKSFPGEEAHQATVALAWCIYVESLLLNERLNQDIKETFGSTPNAPLCPEWLPYFGPQPPQESRDMFAEYVKIRWPIKVFAVDPVVTEQNIADIRSVYRQMQFAVALSYAQGNVGLSAALQAMRKLQRDRATIDLNRTAVGFGHGDDTFGWRFYPRFQTPPVEGNFQAFVRDMVVGGPTDFQLERKREIEPGMRECVAIVLMPSFVPHLTIHSRSNWFRLGSPGHTQNSIHDTLEYSRVVKQMEYNAMQCGQCAHLYRDGEVDRLLKRVHQLDRELDLQTLQCQVPVENTHGGFEILSAGTRELAPELLGWYGAPGYIPNRPCKLFLAGDNFNVSTTKVIAGNATVPFDLLSRQIMEVTLPAGLPILRDRKLAEADSTLYEGYVDCHVATPYGVSGHLLIPVVRDTQAPSRVTITPQVFRVDATATKPVTPGGDMTIAIDAPTNPPSLVQFEIPDHVGLRESANLAFDLYPTNGNDRLKSVAITTTPVGNGSVFTVNSAATANLLKSGTGLLGESIKDYLDYRINEAGSRDRVVRLEVPAALNLNSNRYPVDGSLTIEVFISYK